jgi:hypothetical protein
MPEEIFQLWLDDRIRTSRWPPVTVEWQGFLRQLPFRYWQILEWQQCEVDLRFEHFTSSARNIFDGLVSANIFGVQNEFSSYLQDSKSRIQSIYAYIQEFRALPSTLILLDLGQQLEIVDGCHRLATFFYLKNNGVPDDILPIRQSAWVGRHPIFPAHPAVHEKPDSSESTAS